MSPRPILKSLPLTGGAVNRQHLRNGHVHFPPTPNLSATYLTHSWHSYDRSAIEVSPNDCALPERDCPERTYVICEHEGKEQHLKSVAHRTLRLDVEELKEALVADFGTTQKTDYFSVKASSFSPALTSDISSSDLDDSGGFKSPLPDNVEAHHSHLPIALCELSAFDNAGNLRGATRLSEHRQDTLIFLPHPPLPARERKRSLSLHPNCEQKNPNSPGDSDILSRRRTLSFSMDISSDISCLDGF